MPDGFVRRSGSRLELAGEPYRFAGTNIYWLGLDENVDGVGYPTFFRIRDALDTARAMGFTVVRSHMLASTGNPLSIRPSRDGGLNEAAFATVDYAIGYAGSAGIRLILPLTDEWSYYHGGHRDFTGPYQLPAEAFYTDPRVIGEFRDYLRQVVRRTNPLTGLAYRADPTILAWELGNELNGMTPDWINAVAGTLRAEAPEQLVAAGRQLGIDPGALAAPAVDLIDVHYYPPTVAAVQADANAVTAAGKVYLAGEYASTSASDELLVPLAADPNVTGMLSWSLFGHHDRRGFVPHGDGFTMHHPGDDEPMAAAVAAQVGYAQTVRPGGAGRFEVGPPLITEVGGRAGRMVLQWRGSAGAVGYRVERSRYRNRRSWEPVHDGLVTDAETPWTAPASSGNAWYRVVPVDRHGRAGEPSDPVYVRTGDVVLVDPVETLDLACGYAGVAITAAGGTAVVRPTGAGPGSLTWTLAGTRRLELEVVAATRNKHRLGLAVEISGDGGSWYGVPTRVERTRTHRDRIRHYTIIASGFTAEQVRVVWTGADHRGRGSTGLVRAALWATAPVPAAASRWSGRFAAGSAPS